MTEIFRKSGKKCYSKLLRPGDTFLIKLLSTQGVNDLGVIWKGLGILFRMVCISSASREFENFTGLPSIYGPVPPEVHWSVKASTAW